MKKFVSIICSFLIFIMPLFVNPVITKATSQFPSETNAFVSDHYIDPINQEKPFFDTILPEIKKNIQVNNTHTVTPYYDAFPVANNPENFQGLGSTSYASINGEKVTAEAFYRLKNEGLNDPNCGMGLLIYQCIEYKRAHPQEDVKITYSSYRTSVTASVCVIPGSKYYGYMRSLYGTNYDEQGFVRIAYMLTEAARMGIEVTLVHQLDSYGVNQYDPTTKSLKKRANLKHKKYFEEASKGECYASYAPGKKVTDFLKSVSVEWKVEDMTSDMQHVKSATVSHYLATDGTEHKNAVYFGSANLDENSYIGANGNNHAQSGIIVSDHSELYRITYNYTQLMTRYARQEEMFELRKYVNELNNKQIALINSGKESEIPNDEQIVYLGSKNDKVFELYFTPFGGSADAWDTTANPICKYVSKLPLSEDYVEVIWNEYGYGDCHIGRTFSKMLEKAFCEKPNINNKISMRVDSIDTTEIQKLSLGSQIGYRSIKDGTGVHAKDILLSYKENGKRHNVSLITSCNFYMIAFSYRTNSLLVINETEDCDGDYYNLFAKRYSYGMKDDTLKLDPMSLTLEVGDTYTLKALNAGLKPLTWTTSNKSVARVTNGVVSTLRAGTSIITVSDGKNKAQLKIKVVECLECYNHNKGFTGNINEQYATSNKLGAFPRTFEATFTLDKNKLTGTTTLLGNDDGFDKAFAFTVNKSGNPRIEIRTSGGYNNKQVYVFDKVNVATGKKVNLTLTTNYSNNKMYCFVDGVLVQTISQIAKRVIFEEKYKTVIGGDHLNGNATYFPGHIESIAVWSDTRVAKEVTNDYKKGIDLTDTNLLAAYDFTKCEKIRYNDLSANKNNLAKTVLWQEKGDVEPVNDFDYSFAVVGDTQTMNEKDPEAMESIYDWILKNQKSQKIEYVIGLGDITDDSRDFEWDNAINYIGKLNGKIPYALARGNHDDWDDFNRNLHNGFYEKTVDGMMNSGNVSLTDNNQPGLLKILQPDGSYIYMTREEDIPEGGTVKGDLTNSYRCVSIKGNDYLILTLDFAPTSEALDWANNVIEKHPNHKVIAITHAYMYRDGTTISDEDCYPPTYYAGYNDQQNGDDMWEKCFSKHENVLMVLSGHDPWQHIVYRQDSGDNDNIVTQMLIDAQYVDKNIGSTAMVAMFYFSNDGKTLTVRYYSVEKDCYGSVQSQFTVELEHSYETVINKATTNNNGSITVKCTQCGKVEKKETLYSIKSVELSQKGYVYDGKVKMPDIIAKNSKGDTLKKGVDYTVTYSSGRKNVGNYDVTVKFKGNYSGTKTLSFKIVPTATTVSKLSGEKKSFTVSVTKKTTQITGYQIQYATSKSFTSAKTKLISSYKTTKITFNNLSAKKTYYVRVRTYKTVNGKKYYSSWSNYKSIKTK